MSAVGINREAPAVGSATAWVEAPPEKVWRILSDLANWPNWNNGVSKIRVDGHVAAGTAFVWKAGGTKIVSRLEQVAPPLRIAWSGKIFGIRAVHVWDLAAEAGGTRVRTEESFEGPLARLFPGFARKTIDRALAGAISSLKAESESKDYPRPSR
ncbi:MAG: SRPBCC family protein [Candidatus Moduliflexus flocculans]|nr:SRPBCC family protein [Candidatus Moduliflexus flocculans]